MSPSVSSVKQQQQIFSDSCKNHFLTERFNLSSLSCGFGDTLDRLIPKHTELKQLLLKTREQGAINGVPIFSLNIFFHTLTCYEIFEAVFSNVPDNLTLF